MGPPLGVATGRSSLPNAQGLGWRQGLGFGWLWLRLRLAFGFLRISAGFLASGLEFGLDLCFGFDFDFDLALILILILIWF